MSKDKESISVTVRVRPLSNKELEEDSRVCLKVDEPSNMITMNGLNGEKESKDFYFDSVCDRISQNELFERVGRRSTGFCMEGYNCTIFAYGQTGAGKTFTMMGVNPESRDYHDLRGLIPRTLEHLFDSIEKEINETGIDYMIKCSFVQIYNEQIIDLLGSNNALNIREDMKKGVYIQGVTEELINRSDDALDILRKGSKGRHVGSTCYNETSSRSHSVFTMQIDSQRMNNGIKTMKSRHFHFIDLAGSERTKKSIGDRLKQGCSINKSLHVLSTVIGSLAEVSEGKTRHINYRDSKLTFLLKDSLGGNSKTHVIANISPSWVSSHETRSTLIFARKVKMIKMNKVSINEDSSGNLESLKIQIKRLKSEIILLKNGGATLPYSPSSNQNPQNPSSNSKMIGVLQQYVDEQLDKQTQLHLELSKLANKNSYLQKGIKHFSDNEKQLRMIIAIYEDKVKKLKETEERLLKQVKELSENEKTEIMKDYLENERIGLLDEVEKLKKIGSSTVLVKNLMRDLKMIKEENSNEDDSSIVHILMKNNQFLEEIKSSIKELQPEAQEGKASAVVLKENEEIKAKNEEFSDTIEKQNIELTEMKDKLEETEALLEEAIATQINLQKKLEVQIKERSDMEEVFHQEVESLEQSLVEAKGEEKNLLAKQNELEMIISENKIQMSEMKKDLTVLKEKSHFEELHFKETIEELQTQNRRLEQNSKEKSQQVQKMRSQAIEQKNEIEKISEGFKEDMAELEGRLKESGTLVEKIEHEKADLKTKLQNSREKLEHNLSEKDKQIDELARKFNETKNELKIVQQDFSKETKALNSWKEKCQSQLKQFDDEKLKWEQHNQEMLTMLNEKEVTDSEMHHKITQNQLELMEANQKIALLKNQIMKAEEQHKQELSNLKQKVEEYEEELKEKETLHKQLSQEALEIKRKLREAQENINSYRRRIESFEEELHEKEQNQKRFSEEITKLKEKQKELRIQLNEHRNQIYALKKNNQVETEELREIIKKKDDEFSTLERESLKAKEHLERSLIEIEQLMKNQIEILKENQSSIKAAMESHLKNKEIKISKLEQSLAQSQQNIKSKDEKISTLQDQCENVSAKLAEFDEKNKELIHKLQQTGRSCEKFEVELNETENQHIRVIEEMENNFSEELDAKNAEIQKLRIEINHKDEEVQNFKLLNSQYDAVKNSLTKGEQDMRQLNRIKQRMEEQISELKRMYQQSEHQCGHLESVLVERDEKLTEIQACLVERDSEVEKLKENQESLNDQNKQRSQFQVELKATIKQKQDLIQSNIEEVERKNAQISSITQALEEAENKYSQLQMTLTNLEEERTNLFKELNKSQERENFLMQEMMKSDQVEEEVLSEQEQNNSNGILTAFDRFKSKMASLNKQIDNWSSENSQLKKKQENMEQLHKMIEERQKENNELTQRYNNVYQHSQELCRSFEEQNASKEQRIKDLERNLIEIQEQLTEKVNEISMLKEGFSRMSEGKSEEIHNLNKLFEEVKGEKERLELRISNEEQNNLNAKNGLQIRMEEIQRNLEHQVSVNEKNQAQIIVERERNEELQRYIDEQNERSIEQANINERMTQKVNEWDQEYNRMLKEQEEERQKIASQINSVKEKLDVATKDAANWKNKAEDYNRHIKTLNEQSDKYRKSNHEFKQLLENAHCQIESFKAEAQDKDRLYHQLLEKVSRNDVERKGLMTQDRKISELLEKSRIQVNEYRKKYDDQLKINNLLKQEIQKKEVDSSIIKEKSESYIKNQQQILTEVKSDYSKLEMLYKKKEAELIETHKCIQNSGTKISDLEEKYQKVLDECRNAQRLNEEIKRESMKNNSEFGSDFNNDRQLVFINKLKQENKQLKRRVDQLEESSERDQADLIRLKSQKRYGREGEVSIADYNKKNLEVKYLQKQIDELKVIFPHIEFNNKKPVVDGIKTEIQELQKELTKTKNENLNMKEELRSKTQKLSIFETQKHRTFREEDDTLAKFRTKIGKTSSTFESLRQAKDEEKSILQSKDPNKGQYWGYNK